MKELMIWELQKNVYYYIEHRKQKGCKQIGRLDNFQTFHRNFNSNFYIAEFNHISDLSKFDGTKIESGLGTVPPLDTSYRHSKWFKFYQINKDDILYKQERNLVNNVLKKITNDNNFLWY